MRSDLFASDPDNLLDPPPVTAGIPVQMKIAPLAQLLGCSEVTARRVAVKLPERGLFDVPATLRAYLDRLREQAGRAGRPPQGGDPDALKAEKLKLTAAQREAQEMKNAVARGELVSADEVKTGWASILTDVRAGILAIPARLADLSPDQRAKLDSEIRLALERLSHG